MQKRYECPLPLGISRRSRLSNITVVGLIVAALAVSASPPGLSANDTDHQRRFMAVEQRLKVLEGASDVARELEDIGQQVSRQVGRREAQAALIG